MADFDYIKNRIKNMSISSMLSAARSVRDRSDISTVHTLVDMANCGLRYSAGYTDYLNCGFETKSAAERREVITRGVNNGYVRRMNSRDLDSCFNDKRQLYAIYRDFISRDWLDIEKSTALQIKEFVANRTKIVVRRPDAKGKDGTFVLNLLGVSDYDDLKDRLTRMRLTIAEELIDRHSEMERFCGDSVAVIRVVTACDRVVFACLNSVYNKVSLTAPIDEETGVITSSALDSKNGMYHRHPITKGRFEGFKIPLWREVVAFAENAARVLSSVNYCGWDIAVLPDRVELIDATHFPRHDYYRVADNKRLREKIEKQMLNMKQ